MVGLVRGLVEFVPTSAAWAGYVAGPLVVLGYLVGSIPFGDRVAALRFRRQLDRGRFPIRRFDDVDAHAVITALLGASATLLVATVAWDVGLEASPRGAFSAIGTFANQAVGAWVSLAMWTGAAAVLGAVAPVWTRFRRGTTGVTQTLALLAVYTPVLAVAGAAVAALAFGVIGAGWRAAIAAGLVAVVAGEYVLWVTDTQFRFGIANGPESCLWVAVLAVVVLLGGRPADG